MSQGTSDHRRQSRVVASVIGVLFALAGPFGLQAQEVPPRPKLELEQESAAKLSDEELRILKPGQRYVLDPDHTSVVFAVTHFGTSYTYGRFNRCRGEFRVADDKKPVSFEFVIDAESIDTNNVQRDEYLRGPEFFDVAQFPKIRFDGIKVLPVADSNPPQYRVAGQMTIRGKTRRLEMPLTQVGAGPGPFGKQRIGYYAKFTLRRSDYGMEAMPRQIGDQVTVTFSFEGIRTELVD